MQDPFDQQECFFDNGEFTGFEQIRQDDGVRDSGFIFQAEKDKPVGRAGALTADDGSGDADATAIGQVREIGGADDAELVHGVAMQAHGVRADGESGDAVISGEPLERTHGGERRMFVEFFWLSFLMLFVL